MHYQKVKLDLGGDGATNAAPTGGGTESGALRVTVASDSTGVLSVDDNGSTLSVDDGAGSLTVDNAALAVTGGGVEASALRVTLASDSTGVLSVDDNGGALTVDGTVAATQSGTWTVQPGNTANTTPWLSSIHDGTTKATVRELGTNDALNVAIVDGSGNQITSFGGGTQYAEDAAHTTGDTGTMALAVRKDTAAALAGTDGDYTPLISDASGRLHVNVGNTVTVGSHAVTNAGTFAVQEDGAALTALQLLDDAIVADDAAFTPATTKVMMAGFEYDDTTPDAVNEGDAGAARMSANRNVYTQIRDAAGNERGANVNASGQLSVSVDNTVTVASHAVTNAGTFAVQESGAALTALQLIDNLVLAEDAAHVSGDVGVQALAVRKDAAGALAGTDGDYSPLQLDSGGSLRVVITGGAGSGGTSATDEAAYTPTSSAGTPIMGAADETSPDAAAEGTLAIIRSTLNRALHVNLRDTSGNEVAVGGGTQYDEDTAHVSGDKLTMAGVVRADTPASLAGTDGDRTALIVGATGRLYTSTTVDAALPAGTNAIGKLAANSGVDIGDVDVTSLVPGTGATSLGKAVDSVPGATDTGVAALVVRDDALTTLTPADGDYTHLRTDSLGALWVNVRADATAASGLQAQDTITALNDTVTVAVGQDYSAVVFEIVGTWVATLTFQGSAEGTQYVAIPAVNVATGAVATTTTANGTFRVDASGFTNVRVTATAFTSGTATIDYGASAGSGVVAVTAITPGTGATDLGKAVDAAAGAADTGIALLAVRDDALTTLTPADGDYTHLRVSSTGALHVTGGGGGTEYTVDAAAPAAPTGATFVMERDDALSALTEVEGDWTNPRASANGALWVAVDGTVTVGSHAVTNAGTFAVQVDNTVAVGNVATIGTSVTPGTGATHLGKAEDAAHTTGDVGVMALSVRQNTAAALSGTDGDYQPLITDTNGRLHVLDQNSAAALTALQVIDNPVVVDDAAFTPATTSVMMAGYTADETSTDSVDEGDAGAARMTLDRKVIVTPQPHTAGGLSIFRSLDLDETEEDVKTSAGQVYGWFIANTATSTRFVKFYNATAANVTVGTTTPVMTLPIPGNSSDDVAAHVMGAHGIAFDTAICVAATTGVADNDTGAPGANEVIINIWYK